MFLWERIRSLQPLPAQYVERFPNVQAAIGLEALARLDGWTAQSRANAEYVTRNNKPSSAEAKSWLLKRRVRVYGDKPANALTELDVLTFKNNLLKDRADGRAGYEVSQSRANVRVAV